jgi:YegS/Rv2252/BmrU family lipid kinase
MSRKIIYIINPVSGKRSRNNLREIIEAKTKAKNLPYHIFPSVANGDYSFLISVINEEKITDVVIAGGDGTISQVVGSLMNEKVDFGIIPCGSGNGLALAARILKQPQKALEIIFNGKAVETDGFVVNKTFACMLCGVGFDGKIAHEFSKQQTRGLATYAKLVTRNFFSASPYNFFIEANGVRFSTEAFFISIANSNQFGNNFTIAPRALLADGLLDVVVVKRTAKPLLLFNIVKQILSGKVRDIKNSLDHPVVYFQTEKIRIENLNEAPMHIDGDPAEPPRTIEIDIKKKCFRLIQPV